MRQSELKQMAKVQAMTPKPKPIMAGGHLAGDQFARPEWQQRITRGDGTLARLGAAHAAFYQGHKNLRAVAETPDPEMTPDGHFLKTKRLGDTWLKSAGKQAEDAMSYARAEIEAERRALVADLGLIESHRAGEIRALVRSLDDQERQKILSDAVAAKDAQTIAAITEAPAYLSGMTQEQAQLWGRQYETRHGADRVSRIDTLRKALDVIDRTMTEAVVFHDRLHPHDRLAEIERKQSAAREMQARLSTA